MSILQIKKLSYSYDKTTKKVLNNINYNFEKEIGRASCRERV